MTTFKMKLKIDEELAAYIADYVNEELGELSPPTRSPIKIDSQIILNAVDAYEGGAR